MVKVDDEMVERAWFQLRAYAVERPGEIIRDQVRGLLEAALNPPPEIPVTEEMRRAANRAWNSFQGHLDVFDQVFRAMYAKMPKDYGPGLMARRSGDTR